MTRAYQTPGQAASTTTSCAGGLSRYARASSYLCSIRPSAVLHDRHSSPRTHFPHEDFSSGQQAWSWSMKMGCVRSRARAERELLAGSLAITGLAVVCLWSAYVSLVWRPYRGRTSGSCGGGSNDHSKTAPVLAGWLSAETDYVPRHLCSNQASQPRSLRRASAAARTVPCCCCRRTS